jgi:hypothetical protein
MLRIQSVHLGHFIDNFETGERTPDASHAIPDEYTGRGGSRRQHVRYEHVENLCGSHTGGHVMPEPSPWNGKDVPPELRELHPGRHVVEAVAPALTPEAEAGIDAVVSASARACPYSIAITTNDRGSSPVYVTP